MGTSGVDAVTAIEGDCEIVPGSTHVGNADAMVEITSEDMGRAPKAGEEAMLLKASAMVGTGGTTLAIFFLMRPLEVLGS
jgi:hypothetical protein